MIKFLPSLTFTLKYLRHIGWSVHQPSVTSHSSMIEVIEAYLRPNLIPSGINFFFSITSIATGLFMNRIELILFSFQVFENMVQNPLSYKMEIPH